MQHKAGKRRNRDADQIGGECVDNQTILRIAAGAERAHHQHQRNIAQGHLCAIDHQHSHGIRTHHIGYAEQRHDRPSEQQQTAADDDRHQRHQHDVIARAGLGLIILALADIASDHDRTRGAHAKHRHAAQILDRLDHGDGRIGLRAHMPEDRAVYQNAQRPDRLIEHCRRTDAHIIAHKAAADIQHFFNRRTQHGLLCKAKGIDHSGVDDHSNRRGDRRARHAQRRKTAQAKDQQRIEHDVRGDGAGSADKGNDHALRALQKCCCGLGQRLEGIAYRNAAKIHRCRGNRLRILGEHADDGFGDQQRQRHEEQACRQRKHAHQAVCAVDTLVIAGAKILRDEHRSAAGAAKEHNIEEPRPFARHAHRRQRQIAQPPSSPSPPSTPPTSPPSPPPSATTNPSASTLATTVASSAFPFLR